MKAALFLKIAAWVLIALGVILIGIDILSMTSPSEAKLSALSISGVAITVYGVLLLVMTKRKITKVMGIGLALLVWGYTVIVTLFATAQLGAPFAVLSLLAHPERLPLMFASIAFLTSLTVLLFITWSLLLNPAKKANLGIVALVLLVLFGIPALTSSVRSAYSGSELQATTQADELLTYLEDKYKEEFAAKSSETNTRWRHSFDSWVELTTTAYPVKNPEITFEVKGCIERCDEDNTKSDGYVVAVWEHEISPKIIALLKPVYGESVEYIVSLSSVAGRAQTITSPIPSVESLFGGENEPKVGVSFRTSGAFTKEAMPSEVEKLKQAATIMKNAGYKDFSVGRSTEDLEPPATYRYPRGVTKEDVTCGEHVSISSEKFEALMTAPTLSETYFMSCSYDTEAATGGGLVRSTYPE